MRVKCYAMAMVGAFLLAGCSGGQGTTAASQPVSGVFIDGPAKGVKYVFGNHSGLTGTGGSFSCQEGEVGEFKVGNIVLGHAACAPVVTVLDLVNYDYGAMSAGSALAKASPAVQFLLSIGTVSSDGSIEIPESASARAASHRIDLYAADTAALQTVARDISGNPSLAFVNASTASNHLTGSMSKVYQAKHAGEYISTGWENTGVADIVVHPDGEITGYLLNSIWVFPVAGHVSWDGAYTLYPKYSVVRPVNMQPSGYSDGKGTLTGTEVRSDGIGRFQYVLQRVSSATNNYHGIYHGSMTFSNGFSGDLYFGVDATGKVLGFVSGGGKYGDVAGLFVGGQVNGTTGAMTLEGMAGTITSTGTAASTAPGSFNASRLPVQ